MNFRFLKAILYSVITIILGLLIFFDVIRIDALMYYWSPEREKSKSNKDNIKELQKEIISLKGQIQGIENDKNNELKEMMNSLNSKESDIKELKNENNRLKWQGIFGICTIIDKIIGLLTGIIGIKAAYLAYKLKRVESQNSKPTDEQEKRIIFPP